MKTLHTLVIVQKLIVKMITFLNAEIKIVFLK